MLSKEILKEIVDLEAMRERMYEGWSRFARKNDFLARFYGRAGDACDELASVLKREVKGGGDVD